MLSRLWRKFSPHHARYYSNITSISGSKSNPAKIIDMTVDIKFSVNPRLGNLSLMGQYLSGKPLLQLPASEKAPAKCPTAKSVEIKKFIVEKPVAVKDPTPIKKVINPLEHKTVKKHAIRMLVLRHKKMKKHQLKRLWDRMYLRFRAKRIRLEKNKELEFRGRLAVKVADARKFDAEKYVNDYLSDYHEPLIPKTYKGTVLLIYQIRVFIMVVPIILLYIPISGKRLPEWLIKDLLEKEKIHKKEEFLQGKEVTRAEKIIVPGETVEDFIARKWKKQ